MATFQPSAGPQTHGLGANARPCCAQAGEACVQGCCVLVPALPATCRAPDRPVLSPFSPLTAEKEKWETGKKREDPTSPLTSTRLFDPQVTGSG